MTNDKTYLPKLKILRAKIDLYFCVILLLHNSFKYLDQKT